MAYSKHHKALYGLFKTPQSALWPIQNTTKRFMAYSKHHKALYGLFKTPQSVLWPIQNTTKRSVVVISIIAILSVEVI